MTVLKILRGVPASGKSTYALTLEDYTRVNRDDIRMTMFGSYWGPTVDEGVVTDVENMMIESALRAGRNVVLDATNLNSKALKTKLSLASRYGARVEYKDFPVSLETAIERDASRTRSVGGRVIRTFFSRNKINVETGILKPAPTPLPEFKPYVPNWDLPSAYIVDTDGTVANSDGVRNPYDESRYHLDTPHVHIIEIVKALAHEGFTIIGLSGRDEDYRDVTKAWWHKHDMVPDKFFMRSRGDKTMDAIVKYDIFKEHIEPNFNVLGAFDDRLQVIRMWRAIGVPVLDVGKGVEF